jgi:hypothetical protein
MIKHKNAKPIMAGQTHPRVHRGDAAWGDLQMRRKKKKVFLYLLQKPDNLTTFRRSKLTTLYNPAQSVPLIPE